MKWFKHDSDAHRDAKLKKLLIKYGLQGYGLYFYCLELIVNNIDESNLTFELEYDSELIAHDLNLSHELIQEMMTYMVNLGLFESDSGRITCLKIAKRLDKSMTSNSSVRKLIDSVRESHDSVMMPSSKVMLDKKRRDKKRSEEINTKARNRAVFVKPSIQEIREYATEASLTNLKPSEFFNYYESVGWVIGRQSKKMTDWKAAARGWNTRNMQ